MLENKTKMYLQDSRRINVHEPYQIGYWSKRLNCTPQQLRDAVASVGTSVADVWKHLEGRHA